MSLAQHIGVSTIYTRSVNIERDKDLRYSNNYILTSRGIQTLKSIIARFPAKDVPRAWSLIGPYGAGKSSFALFLASLLSNPATSKQSVRLLKDRDPALAKAINKETKGTEGYLTVMISGTPESLEFRYLRALYYAMTNYYQHRKGKKPDIFKKMHLVLANKELSTAELISITQDCQRTLSLSGCPGILIVFDELGKFLEYESLRQESSSIFLLQLLAEHAYKNHSTKLFIVVLLHQSIERYAVGVSEYLKNEWAKIQGRFEEIPYLDSPEQVLRIVEKAIVPTSSFSANIEAKIKRTVQSTIKILHKESLLGEARESMEGLFKNLYPLHPLSAIILPYLCQLISQNERTLFSYLSSAEHNGFREMLNKTEPGKFILPAHIFDYFLMNQATLGGDHLAQRRWAEVVAATERMNNLGVLELGLLKTIGIINLLGNRGGIRASASILTSVYGAKTKELLTSLLRPSAIVHRKFNNEYRIWQGSDFDLDKAVTQHTRQIGSFSLADELSDNMQLPPIVARKYSIEKGALRYFPLRFIDTDNFKKIETSLAPQILIFIDAARGGGGGGG